MSNLANQASDSIQRLPDGSVDWGRTLSTHRPWLVTVLLARGVEAGAIEEVLQEVGSAAIANASQLKEVHKVAPWLYRIAVVQALQYRRRLGRQKKLVERYAERVPESTTSSEPDPLGWLLAKEQRQLVRQAIAAMPGRDAEMLLLKYTQDWSYRELADHLGISTSAVEARLHRARQKMRQALARLSPELVSR